MTSLSPVKTDIGSIGKSSAKEWAIRFIFGGLVTAVVGVVATTFGPVVAGLFLAFPAIAIASLTLIADHDNRSAAGADALGGVAGSIGLVVFGLIVWGTASRLPAVEVLAIATLAWLAVSLAVWASADAWRRRGRT
jgi:uncharacterized membrane protein (GlpM family)